MRTGFVIALMATLLLAGTYWYQSAAALCPIPVSYQLGTLDPAFDVSPEKAKTHIANAVAVWERAVDRELFVYDEAAALTVNFVFDERQETTDSEATQRSALAAQRTESEAVQEAVESLQAEYDALSSAYEAEIAAYEAQLAAYNAEVSRYNDRGGAPPEVYETLEAERVALEATAETLTNTATKLNTLAAELNTLATRGNELVDAYNAAVNRYNAAFGYHREFTQGDYHNGQINIYTFTSDTELERVLAHEFGHALGIGHVEDDTAVMYYLLQDTAEPPQLSAADQAAFIAVCGSEETTGQVIRRTIREFLSHF